jgi:hypothetical protein
MYRVVIISVKAVMVNVIMCVGRMMMASRCKMLDVIAVQRMNNAMG